MQLLWLYGTVVALLEKWKRGVLRSDRLLGGLCHLLNTHDRGMPSKLQTGWPSWILAATGLSQLVLGFGLCLMLSQQGGDGLLQDVAAARCNYMI